MLYGNGRDLVLNKKSSQAYGLAEYWPLNTAVGSIEKSLLSTAKITKKSATYALWKEKESVNSLNITGAPGSYAETGFPAPIPCRQGTIRAVSMWVYTTSLANAAQFLVNSYHSGAISWSVSLAGTGASVPSSVIVSVNDTSGLSIQSAQDTITTNKWFHICANFSSSAATELYINGALQSVTNNYVATGASGNFTLCATTKGAFYLTGYLSDVRIYIINLSESNVRDIYENPLNIFTIRNNSNRWFYSGSVNVEASLTGLSTTISGGTLTNNNAIALSGFNLSCELGSLAANFNKSLSGFAASIAQETLVSSIDNTLTGQSIICSNGLFVPETVTSISGQSLAIAEGGLIASLDKTLSGQEIVCSNGTLATEIITNLVGHSLSLAQGTLSVTIDKSLSGLVVSIEGGTLTVQIGGDIVIELTGLSISAALGILIPDIQSAIVGSGIALSQGSLTSAIVIALLGNGLTISQGTLTVVNADVTLELTGQSLSILQSSLSPSINTSLTGLGLTLDTGLLIPEIIGIITGQGISASQGVFSVDIQCTLAGLPLTLSIGNLFTGVSAESVQWIIYESRSKVIIAESKNNKIIVGTI